VLKFQKALQALHLKVLVSFEHDKPWLKRGSQTYKRIVSQGFWQVYFYHNNIYKRKKNQIKDKYMFIIIKHTLMLCLACHSSCLL